MKMWYDTDIEIWYKIYQKIIRVKKKHYHASICNLLLRAQGIPEIYFLCWFSCSAVITSSQWNVSEKMWCRLMKHLIFLGGLHENKNCRFPLMVMSNVSEHANMQSWCWVDSLLVGMLNYNSRGSWSIHNLRRNIWNKVNKSRKIYWSKELSHLFLLSICLILPEFYFREEARHHVAPLSISMISKYP